MGLLSSNKPAPPANSKSAQSRARATTIAPWDEPPNPVSDEVAPWDVDPQARMAGTRPFNQSYFNDDLYKDEIPPPRPANSRMNSEEELDPDARRPSMTSQSTASSAASKSNTASSQYQRKSLKGFFGDDPQDDSRKGSQAQLSKDVQAANEASAARNNSIQTLKSGEDRPNTPKPTSNVTPWEYQNFEDVENFGSAPIRPEVKEDQNGGKNQSTPSSKRGFLHRHSKSKEDPPKSTPSAPTSATQRPSTSRESSSSNVPYTRASVAPLTPTGSSTNVPRGSVAPTSNARQETNGQSEKRGLFSKLKNKKKDKAPPAEPAPSRATEPFPPPQDTQGSGKRGIPEKKQSIVPPLASEKRDRETSVASVDSVSTIKAADAPMPKLDRTSTFSSVFTRHGKRERGPSQTSKAEEKMASTAPASGGFSLDLNLDDMEGILRAPTNVTLGEGESPFGNGPLGTPSQELSAPAWDAPDSWAVKGQNEENLNQLPEGAEHGLPPIEEEDGISYFMRVFRTDGTFATLSMTINATVAEVLQSLGKKSMLPDSIDKYQLILRKNQLSRQLDSGERPIAMQKKLLQQAGYQESDQIENVGRDDNSYLCRFTFSHEKQAGFGSGLDNDPTFNKEQKFTHVDLSGRSLVTIPIILYTRAAEIRYLNLSRNLALSVPKDFITMCTSLIEIKFTGNEAWRLPASLAWASRLQMLDLSNNRLDQLEHAELHRLTSLVSLKLSNNNLESLPTNFSHFRKLRSLNLSSNNFTELPEHICNLKALADLDISFNKISALPKISNIKTLERLWMTNNNLKGPFNESFKDLINLKEIDARFNAVTNIDNVAGLPNLEQLLVGHNNIAAFKGSFKVLRSLVLDHCPVTSFDLEEPLPSLAFLNIASAKLVELKDSIFDNMPNLQKLILDKNHFSHMPAQIGRLSKLEHLSMVKNRLSLIPPSIGNLLELKYLNLRECNLKSLPSEIWYCKKLETLNVSSNVLETFPKAATAPPPSDVREDKTPALSSSPSFEELGPLEDFQARRPSQASAGMMSGGSSPSARKGSVASMYGTGSRKMSAITRTNTETSMSAATRKDSNISQARIQNTFAGSLQYLYLADNRLEDEVFRELARLVGLRMLNLSYNEIDDFPQGVLRCWPQLTELYLSGNTLTSLPFDDLEESSNLKALFLNGNRFQVLPAELCNVHSLSILDVGSNSLKYNVSNWPYDWNWNKNTNLKYLNFSANKRLEIKPAAHSTQNQYAAMNGSNMPDLTSFNTLKYLRILGLMDVTLLTNNVPEDTEDRRVRTSASSAGAMSYGMADTLGKNDHLSTLDLLKPNFRSHEAEILVGMFDGQSLSSGGSKVARYLHENFSNALTMELNETEKAEESPTDALRRTFLSLNKDMANYASSAIESREHRLQNGHRGSTIANVLSTDDLNAGSVASVLYVNGIDLYVANVGDIEAILIQNNGQYRELTRKHDPAEIKERDRIRAAGGYVSRRGKLNDVLQVSRAFGYFSAMPSVIAAPYTMTTQFSDADELIVMATKEFWDFVTVDFVVDLARAEKEDPMVAAQKLRDLAIAFGARDKIMVMVLGVSDLRKRNHARQRGGGLSMAPQASYADPDGIFPTSRKKKGRDGAGDSRLARLGEVEAPTGELAICFTDIKNSTALWEILPIPMRSGIQLHNELMRRQLRLLGGYEVKTEGDAFMCSFPTATSALLWCFSCQSHLLELPWPTEILDTVHCQEKFDSDGNKIYRGLSVRMGIHWGKPVCEPDPITRRMDYFGPMVNKAARVSAVADGGQISVSTDFIGEIQRTLEAYADDDRRDSTASQETTIGEDRPSDQVRQELRQLSTQGFEVKDLGEKKLKGLENPEFIYLMYPHSLAGRLNIPPGAPDQPAAAAAAGAEGAQPGSLGENSSLSQGLELDEVWKLWDIALRLEMLCSCLEDPSRSQGLRKPEMSLLTSMKERGGVVSDNFMINLMEHQVTRVENCTSTLQLRHMLSPLEKGLSLQDQGKPITEMFAHVREALAFYNDFKNKREIQEENHEEKTIPASDE